MNASFCICLLQLLNEFTETERTRFLSFFTSKQSHPALSALAHYINSFLFYRSVFVSVPINSVYHEKQYANLIVTI